MEVTPAPDRGIMVPVPCPNGHVPSVIKVPAEGEETPLDVYFRMAFALFVEGVDVPLHYAPYGYPA